MGAHLCAGNRGSVGEPRAVDASGTALARTWALVRRRFAPRDARDPRCQHGTRGSTARIRRRQRRAQGRSGMQPRDAEQRALAASVDGPGHARNQVCDPWRDGCRRRPRKESPCLRMHRRVCDASQNAGWRWLDRHLLAHPSPGAVRGDGRRHGPDRAHSRSRAQARENRFALDRVPLRKNARPANVPAGA